MEIGFLFLSFVQVAEDLISCQTFNSRVYMERVDVVDGWTIIGLVSEKTFFIHLMAHVDLERGSGLRSVIKKLVLPRFAQKFLTSFNIIM